MPRNKSVFAVLYVIGLAACSSGEAPQANSGAMATPDATLTTTTIALPESVTFPEGVALHSTSGDFFTASAEDGTLVRVNASTDPATVTAIAPAGAIVPAGSPFPALLGMKSDGRGRLWISGGITGRMWVVSEEDGSILADVATPEGSLINDVVLVGGAGYFTDTFRPTLWRLAEEGGSFGALEPWLDLATSPIPYTETLNLNGIAATADGSTLIVIHMDLGRLFAIDVATKAIREIETGGEDLSGGDGLVLDGSTLYLVRQPAAEIVTLRLDAELTQGTVVSRFRDPALAWPATAALSGGDLVVVNSQFNTRDGGTPARPFSLLRVPTGLLNGR